MLRSYGPLLVLPHLPLEDIGRSRKLLWLRRKNLALIRGSVEIAAPASVPACFGETCQSKEAQSEPDEAGF